MQIPRDTISFFDVLESFVDFNPSDLEIIYANFRRQTVPKGELLLTTQKKCYFWAFVNSGLIRIFSYTSSGKEVTNWFVKEGQLLTEFVSFFNDQTKSLENMVALEDTEIVFIDYQTLQKLIKEIPAFDKFCRVIYEAKLIEMKRNILHRIQDDAKSRYLYFANHYPELLQRVPLKFIASYLNMTDSSLSRIRKKILDPAS